MTYTCELLIRGNSDVDSKGIRIRHLKQIELCLRELENLPLQYPLESTLYSASSKGRYFYYDSHQIITKDV
jgi:hypothetical protein